MKSIALICTTLLLIQISACNSGPTVPIAEAKKLLNKNQSKKASNFSIGILTEVLDADPKTGEPKTEINLISPQFPEHLFLARDYNYTNISKEKWEGLGIPKDATLAFQSSHKGKGSDYCLTLRGDIVELKKRNIIEGDKKELRPFSPYRTLNLNKRKPLDGTFVCFQSDEDENLRKAVYFSADAKARAIRYERKKDWTHLTYNTSIMQDGEGSPTFMDQYLEYFRGKKIGIFNLTHADEWDYVKYARFQDGKEISFTIDHEATLVDGERRKTPCFEE